MENRIDIGGRWVGKDCLPLVIAEIGINHEGSFDKAVRMVEDAHRAGCECVKLQCHIVDDEMIENDVVPANADESIWNMMQRCSLAEAEEAALKELVESKGMIFLSTPFSRAAADRLNRMGVAAFKIGSGECNNYPLVRHIAGFGKPIILSTGMNDLKSVAVAVDILEASRVPYALLHCTSLYPTPYAQVRLGAMLELAQRFPRAVIGLSDHSIGNYTCFAAVALGAALVEKHFTSDANWPGPDIPISITPDGLADLVRGTAAIHRALGGSKEILAEETPTIRFAYASVVTIKPVKQGERFTEDNIWVKRPGTGEILAPDFPRVLGRRARRDLPANSQLKKEDVG
ncbi:MAG TPA: polyhydroxyalkanoate biosynthesis repressor PhaR [Desulfobacterales bacterium]|nr:polyhydroxyalkanoate biosynthesis repressor PhaR [Desulfobacterales bacterium]